MNYLIQVADRIPQPIRLKIREGQLIAKAINTDVHDTPMEYLFDVYEEFIDISGEHDDWNCWRCRQHILEEFKKMKDVI